MTRLRSRWFLLPILLAGVLAALWAPRWSRRPEPEGPPPDDKDIPQLAAYLREKGLALRVVSTRKDGALHPNAFLTTTASTWQELNRLPKDPAQIELWRGTLYCERDIPRDMADLDRLWGDCYCRAGPFVFFGDRVLLEKVRVVFGV